MYKNKELYISYKRKIKRAYKNIAVTAMGGKCKICGYNKHNCSLHFHHINPKEKDFNFNIGENVILSTKQGQKRWKMIVKELKKCILVCSNCHAEIHYGVRSVTESMKQFDSAYEVFKNEFLIDENGERLIDNCSICGRDKFINFNFCSLKCASIYATKVNVQFDWSNIDLKTLSKEMSTLAIAKKLGVCYTTVVKRQKKLNIKPTSIKRLKKIWILRHKKELIEMNDANVSMQEMEKHFKKGRKFLSSCLKDLDIKKNNPTHKYNWEKHDLDKMLKDGLTVKQISDIIGCTESNIYFRIKKENVCV
jgi:hypothetical protein